MAKENIVKKKRVKKKSTKLFLEKEDFKKHKRFFGGLILGYLVGIGLGASVTYLSFPRPEESNTLPNQSEIASDKSASKKSAVQQSPVPAVPVQSPLSANYSFSGTVSKIEGNKIFVDYFSCGKGNKTYSVTATKSTLIIKRENGQENKAIFSAIKKNDNVIVAVSEDINKKSDLTAQEIKIMSEANAVSPPTNESIGIGKTR